MSINTVCLGGNLTRDPEAISTTTGKNGAKFSIAVNTGKNKAVFMDCIFWESNYNAVEVDYILGLEKGDSVVVSGRLDDNSYEQEGRKVNKIQTVVNSVHLGKGDAKPRGEARGKAQPAPTPDELDFDPFSEE